MRIASFAILRGACLSIALGLAFTASKVDAASNSAFDIGINYYGSDVGKSLTGATGFFLHFQVKSGRNWIYPTFGASLETMSGNASLPGGTQNASLLAGQIEGGVEVLPATAYVNPFIAVQGLLGWASLSLPDADTRSLALAYGFVVSGGTEIRFSAKEDAKGIRLRTAFRFLTGNLAGISGFQLNALQVGIGMVF
ncbi:MAG: hypothetical protein IT285_05035 [Bdellovibrionales bacterium]|nr:hypothetical protein [Bdellovibrionales bacterium]